MPALGDSARPPACPGCHSSQVKEIGAIPAAIFFAGRQLDAPIPGGRLFRCTSCGLGFRHPHLTSEQLDRLYSLGAADSWSTSASEVRRDWDIAHRWIRSTYARGAILDVGCFDGGFLGPLSTSYELYGIEIHKHARQRAQERGVRIADSGFLSRSLIGAPFTFITCFDVIEHVENPFEFVSWLRTLLADNGYLIISSGNADARTWTFMGSRYWYCAIPEHIAFVSPRWFRTAAQSLGMTVLNVTPFAHRSAPFSTRLLQCGVNLGYRLAPGFVTRLPRRGLRRLPADWRQAVRDAPPSWNTARDHFLVILSKNST